MTVKDSPLTQSQLVILTKAAARPDRLILPLPKEVRAKGASQQRLLASLLKRGLVEEVAMQTSGRRRRSPEPVHVYLRLTEAGASAAPVIQVEPARTAVQISTATEAVAGTTMTESIFAPGGKLGCVLLAIGAPSGATLDDLVNLTGWQKHTMRAAITRLKQRGHKVRLVKAPDRKAYELIKAPA